MLSQVSSPVSAARRSPPAQWDSQAIRSSGSGWSGISWRQARASTVRMASGCRGFRAMTWHRLRRAVFR